jgi:Ca-activated chloride channel family protein
MSQRQSGSAAAMAGTAVFTGLLQLVLKITLRIVILLFTALVCSHCDKKDQTAGNAAVGTAAQTDAPVPPGAINVTFLYGSEKQKWIDDVTAAFNGPHAVSVRGKPVHVTAIPTGSGECIDDVLAGRIHADAISPASGAFITLGNARSRASTGKDLVGSTDKLVLSPVVIAMWKPMADALSANGAQPLGWADVLAMAKDPAGWASHGGHAEWGTFKFGHTHPEFSNSGLISVLAEVYAGAGKVKDLTVDDVNRPEVGQFVEGVERSIVHYGSSTGFFGRRMFSGGPAYLSAAVLYENMVIESYDPQTASQLPFPIVAVYPREGTFWSDHPVGIVQREWVDDEHREAAQAYIDYLLAEPQQRRAMDFGFRPGDPKIALSPIFDAVHGVDPKQPTTTLQVPTADVMNAALQLWHAHKKHADIVLVLDTSGSMSQQQKLTNAKAGAVQMISMLDDADILALLPFSDQMRWATPGTGIDLKTGRQQLTDRINSLYADGGTRLYDSIDAAYEQLTGPQAQKDRIAAVVVLTDGEDTASRMKLNELLARVKSDESGHGVRIFTIGYGSDANADVLGRIADQTRAKFYAGKPENIREVFKDVATFF